MSEPSLLPPTRRLARLSVEKYEAMVASGVFSKEDRFELIEGSLVEKMTKNPPPSVATALCREAIAGRLPIGWHVRQEQPVRIPSRDSEPEPDLCVARGAIVDYLKGHPGPSDVALVIEVSDATLADDRALAASYGGGGIPAYWIVNIPDRQLEIYDDPSAPASPVGYRRRRVLHPGDEAPLTLDGREAARVPVADLLPPAAG